MSKDEQRNSNSVPRRRNARLWRAAAVAAAVAVTGLLAACGGRGSHAPGPGPSPGQNLAVELDSFASCMRGHGVAGFHFTTASPPSDVASLGIDGYYAEYDSGSAFDAAEKACHRLDPFGTAPSATHQQFLKALKSAECMRSHGYPDWPDPNPTRLGFRLPASIDTNSTQFQAAATTCGVPANA